MAETDVKSLQMQLVIGALKRLELIKTRPEFKQKLWENVNLLQSGLKERGFTTLGKVLGAMYAVFIIGGAFGGGSTPNY